MVSTADGNAGVLRAARPRGRWMINLDDTSISPGSRRHHHDAVGEQDRLVDAVGDEDHGLAGREPQLLEIDAHLFAGQRVERAEGLVHQQQRRVVDQRSRDRGALLHAARKLVGIARSRNRPDRPRRAVAGRESMMVAPPAARACRSGRARFRGRPPFEQDRLLEDDADVGDRRGRRGGLPSRPRRAVGMISPPIRRIRVLLPQPDGPTTAMNSPLADIEVDAVQGDGFRRVAAEDLGDVAEPRSKSGASAPRRRCPVRHGFDNGTAGRRPCLLDELVGVEAVGWRDRFPGRDTWSAAPWSSPSPPRRHSRSACPWCWPSSSSPRSAWSCLRRAIGVDVRLDLHRRIDGGLRVVDRRLPRLLAGAHEALHQIGIVLDGILVGVHGDADRVDAEVGEAQRIGVEALGADGEDLVVDAAEQRVDLLLHHGDRFGAGIHEDQLDLVRIEIVGGDDGRERAGSGRRRATPPASCLRDPWPS